MFDAIFNGRIDTGIYNFIPVMEDVEYLNREAINGNIQLTKMSYFTFLQLTDRFQMLRSGGALGLNCGPLLIANDPSKTLESDSLVAIPGVNTTANLLLSIAHPELRNKVEVMFSDIEHGVLSGKYDFGLIIHESRFTYRDKGLYKYADLGEYWESQTQSAIPLGGIAIQRSMDPETKKDISNIISASVHFAFENPDKSRDYIKEHAQEMDPNICQLHIETYVNQYSKDISDFGITGVDNLAREVLKRGLTEEITRPLFVADINGK